MMLGGCHFHPPQPLLRFSCPLSPRGRSEARASDREAVRCGTAFLPPRFLQTLSAGRLFLLLLRHNPSRGGRALLASHCGWARMACRCVLVQTVEEDKGDEGKPNCRVPLRRCRTEAIFPMYALGRSKLNSLSRTILDTAGDPIWDSVRADARIEAEKEQILSSFLYASVLSHDCFERALGFVLANRLQDPTLLATQLMDIFFDVMSNDRGIQRSIRLDAQAFKDRDPACASYSWALLYLKGYHSLQSYRIAHALWNQGRKILALALQSRISEVFAVDIHPAARIGEGIMLDHGTGLVIGETAVVGNWVSLMQGVTLGGTGKEVGDRHPKIGQGALIGASATVLGNISVGEGAMIAAGSLVLKNVPPHSMAVGNPANIVGYIEDEDPSLTMKHDAGKDYFEHIAVSSSEGLNNGNHCSGGKG